MEEEEIILLRISGEDRPGVTSSLTGILGKYHATILDIGQSTIHQTLSLGIMFKLNSDSHGGVLKDLLFKAYEFGLVVKFTPIEPERYTRWVGLQGKEKFVITLLGNRITAQQLSKVTEVLANENLNIDTIKRLTGRIPLGSDTIDNSRACVELSLRGTLVNKTSLHTQFIKLSAELGIDISFQSDNIFRRNRRLICFDMDSTLIKTEVIDELADRAGVSEQVRSITAAAMRGEIDFVDSFKQRVALLKGLDESVMKEVADNLPIMEGAERLMHTLKKCGYKIAILSGGFTYFGEVLKKKFDVDYVFANELEIVDGKLTGKHKGDIVDGQRKADLLKLLAQQEKIELEQVIAVGDGANDLPMLNVAGLGIAFHAKQKVKENARQSISTIGLDGVLYFIGFRDTHIF